MSVAPCIVLGHFVKTKVEAEYFEDQKFYEAKIDRCFKNGKFLVSLVIMEIR
eukprot:TRINITY_DN4443_c0_g1_i1.p1 TRINITY_DN4443_c0_g1~~TRINITY_DN4443_c0_g1_i1.p1  ORF type:complete len:52 (+),score=6.11 TRINITY_DN4443_c0_g1_i1:814-969(+)